MPGFYEPNSVDGPAHFCSRSRVRACRSAPAPTELVSSRNLGATDQRSHVPLGNDWHTLVTDRGSELDLNEARLQSPLSRKKVGARAELRRRPQASGITRRVVGR